MSYVNVKLEKHVGSFSDTDVLSYIRDKIQDGQCYLTKEADMNKITHVASIWVPSPENQIKEFNAFATASRWLHEYPTQGLPLNRVHLFR